MYLCNLFPVMSRHPQLLEPFLEKIQKKMTIVSNSQMGREDFYEAIAYLTFFRGVMLRHVKRMDESLRAFLEVISL